MEFKGTKGEWKSVYLPKTEYYLARYEIQYGQDGECVAEFVHDEFDAKLIAAAPDLLEALQELMRVYEEKGQLLSFNVDIARKAIEKALL